MRLALIGRQSSSRYVLLVGLGLAVLVGLTAAVAHLTHDHLFHGRPLMASPAPPQASSADEASAVLSVSLPDGKLKTADIRTEPASTVDLPAEVSVAGTIEANPNRRVDIRPRVPGVIRSVNVSPSQRVKAGTVLAVLDSAEVGTARLDLRARQLDLSIARTEAEWKSVIAANVEALIPELRKGTPAPALEKQFADKPLGAQRGQLLSAYADFEIASHEEQKQTDLQRRKIVGEHPVFVAVHAREAAQAKFEAALEQVRFDAAQQKRLADQQVRRAEAAVIDAAKRLQIMGVQDGPDDALGDASSVSPESAAAEDVTAYPLVAPFDGTITGVSAVFSQRAEPADVLFTVADLSKVWVVGNVNESDLAALAALEDGTVGVTAAAYPGRTFEAKVLFSGSSVDPTTRRVPLVAEMPNPDGLMRLGMFVRIRLDGPADEATLTVPSGAVVEVDGRPAVFIPDRDGKTFTLRPVEPGRSAMGRRAIKTGLAPGERVVTAGAFLLKSELILRDEPEED